MALILTPPPGTYTSDQTVTITSNDDVDYIILTDTGVDPVVVRTVAASDNYAPTIYPYVQVVDDGRGRAVFDGSFPKYYNSQWNGATDFAGLTPGAKFLYNALNYLRGTGTRVLFLGDKGVGQEPGPGSYELKSLVSSTGFIQSLQGVSNILGLNATFRDSSEWPNTMINITYAECMQYDVIFFMSSRANVASLSTAAANNIAQARRAGVGIYICTDNGGAGGPGRYPEDYYLNANILLGAFTDAHFSGSMDFSPGTSVLYNKTNYGDSPLFNGLSDSDLMIASTSDSFVVQDLPEEQYLPVTVNVGEGYTTVKIAVIDSQGNITFEQHGYNVGQPPIIELVDEDGQAIEGFPQTNLRLREVRFRYLPGAFGNASGFVKVDDTVVAEFNNVAAGEVNASWLATEYTLPFNPGQIQIPGAENPTLYVEITEPIAFVYEWSLNRLVPDAPTTDIAKFVQQINVNEFQAGVTTLGPLSKALKLLSRPSAEPSTKLPVLVNNVYDAWTRNIPSLLLVPTAQEIKDTWPQYIAGSSTTNPNGDDADFIIENGVLTNTINADCSNSLLSPYLSPSLYQYTRISSSNPDDDWIGLVVGMKTDANYMYMYLIDFALNSASWSGDWNGDDTSPRLELRMETLPIGAQPGLPNIVYAQPSQYFTLARFPDFPADTSLGYSGWQSPGWVDGISLDVSFDGRNLQIRCPAPGAQPSDDFYVNLTINPTTHPVLQGVEPRAGLHVQSQVGGRWSNYTVIRTG